MLIWWHRLTSELTTDPTPGLGQHDQTAHIARCQCRRHTAAAASDNQHVTGHFRMQWGQFLGQHDQLAVLAEVRLV